MVMVDNRSDNKDSTSIGSAGNDDSASIKSDQSVNKQEPNDLLEMIKLQSTVDDRARRTAATLALQSADGHNTRTGRRLKRFGEKMSKKVATNEFERNKASDKSIDPKRLWTNAIDANQKNKKTIYNKFSELQVKGKYLRDMEVVEESVDLLGQTYGSIDDSPIPMAKQERQLDKIDDLAWDQLIVEVRDLTFSYSLRKKFMNKLNMSVPTGAIYGLLGPSGCGKTTLLKMILGLMKPTSGSVKVNGKIPGKTSNDIPGIGVGYMPQELALFRMLTLREALTYFGKIYGLTNKEINNRINIMVSFLDLPDPDRRINQMSGGQQRRVSLSLSLVHNPPLLILDEPTVGTDPVLRERIWDHLIVLSHKESTTVIITTHYIEEARRAHVVAFMREGNLLVEHSPPSLLAQLQLNNLEDVFLKLCRSQATNASDLPQSYYLTRNAGNQTDNRARESIDLNVDRRTKIRTEKVDWHSRIMAQTRKNYINLIRSKTLLVFETVLPAVCMIIFALCIGTKPTNLKVGVYNADYTEENLQRNPNEKLLSMVLLEQIDGRTIFLKHYTSKEQVIADVANDNRLHGALIFNEHFTTCLIERINLAMIGRPVPEDVLENSTAHFYGDFTDMVITETLIKAMLDAQTKFQRKMISAASNSTQTSLFDPLINITEPIYGSLEPQFRDFIAPGIILSIIFMMATGLTALSLVVERKEGLMQRTEVAGVKQHEIMAGQIILQFMVILVQVILLLIFTFLVFRITIKGNIGLVILIVLMQGISGMCYGLVISAVVAEENMAVMAALGTFYPQLFLSGIVWPLEGMPDGLRQFSYFLPQTLPILSFRNIILKGWDLSYLYVYAGFLSSLCWTCIFLLIAFTSMKIRDNPHMILEFFTKGVKRNNK